jgi:hypothetical protein
LSVATDATSVWMRADASLRISAVGVPACSQTGSPPRTNVGQHRTAGSRIADGGAERARRAGAAGGSGARLRATGNAYRSPATAVRGEGGRGAASAAGLPAAKDDGGGDGRDGPAMGGCSKCTICEDATAGAPELGGGLHGAPCNMPRADATSYEDLTVGARELGGGLHTRR